MEVTDAGEDGIFRDGDGGGRGGVTGTGDMDLIRGGRTLGDPECEGGLSGRVVVPIVLVLARTLGG